MNALRLLQVLLVLLLSNVAVHAQHWSPQPWSYRPVVPPAWYEARMAANPDLYQCPCGPDWLPGPFRKLVPQGFMGADFRSACHRHDICYETHGCPRLQCDQRFYYDTWNACANSAWPGACRGVAYSMYLATRSFGGRLYGQPAVYGSPPFGYPGYPGRPRFARYRWYPRY